MRIVHKWTREWRVPEQWRGFSQALAARVEMFFRKVYRLQFGDNAHAHVPRGRVAARATHVHICKFVAAPSAPADDTSKVFGWRVGFPRFDKALFGAGQQGGKLVGAVAFCPIADAVK